MMEVPELCGVSAPRYDRVFVHGHGNDPFEPMNLLQDPDLLSSVHVYAVVQFSIYIYITHPYIGVPLYRGPLCRGSQYRDPYIGVFGATPR